MKIDENAHFQLTYPTHWGGRAGDPDPGTETTHWGRTTLGVDIYPLPGGWGASDPGSYIITPESIE